MSDSGLWDRPHGRGGRCCGAPEKNAPAVRGRDGFVCLFSEATFADQRRPIIVEIEIEIEIGIGIEEIEEIDEIDEIDGIDGIDGIDIRHCYPVSHVRIPSRVHSIPRPIAFPTPNLHRH